MDVSFSMAARLITGLSGPARRVALALTEQDLFDRRPRLQIEETLPGEDEEHDAQSHASETAAAQLAGDKGIGKGMLRPKASSIIGDGPCIG